MGHYKLNPDIIHHIVPIRDNKLKRKDTFDLDMYKYIPLNFVLKMLEKKTMVFNNVDKWEDVYENFVQKENIMLLNSKRDNLLQLPYYGQSWTSLEESDAMWRIYSHPKDNYAVKVKTVYPKIVKMYLLNRDMKLDQEVDRVYYAEEQIINDWLLKNSPMNLFAYFELVYESLFVKRLEFKHEMEVRIIIHPFGKDEYHDSISLQFDPLDMFDEIVIDPRVSEEEYEQQFDCLTSHGYDGSRIRKSSLYDFKKIPLEIDMSEPLEFKTTVRDSDGQTKEESLFMKAPE